MTFWLAHGSASGKALTISFCNFDCCLLRLDGLGLVISSHSFGERQHGGDVYRGGRFLLMFCWMKSDTTALPSISKSSWAFSMSLPSDPKRS